MGIHEDIIASDPILKRVFLSPAVLVPLPGNFQTVNRRYHKEWLPHLAELGCQRGRLAEAVLLFFKAKTAPAAEAQQFRIRDAWQKMREHAEGYSMEMMPADGCEHVVLFAHDAFGEYFNIDEGKRFAVWRRYARSAPPFRRRLSRFRRSAYRPPIRATA